MNGGHDMRKREATPRFGVIEVLFVGTLGLFWLEERSVLTPVERQIMLLAIILLFFALTFAWLVLEGRRLR